MWKHIFLIGNIFLFLKTFFFPYFSKVKIKTGRLIDNGQRNHSIMKDVWNEPEDQWTTDKETILEWKIKGKKQSYKLIYKWLHLLLTNQKETWEYAHQRRKVVNEISEKLTKSSRKNTSFQLLFSKKITGGLVMNF